METARYRQIYQQLRQQILSGHYPAGSKLPTEMELAVLYGVSRVTSAAALTALARDGLVQRTPRRGTIVSAAALPGRSDPRPVIAWIQPDVDPPFGVEVLRGVEQAARQAGLNLLLHLTGASRQEEEKAISDALAAGAAGIGLFLVDGETYNAQVLRLVLDGFPVVLVDRYLRGVHCASVQSDNVAGTRELVSLLVQAGHRQICALIFPPKGTSTIEDRLDGYTQALAAAGVHLDLSLIYEQEPPSAEPIWSNLSTTIVERFADYLQSKPEITAIFAANATLALVVFRAAEYLGLRIPDDLSVVNIDFLPTLPLTVPSFTYARQQSMEIGRTAVQLLQEQLAGQPARRIILPMTLHDEGSISTPHRGMREVPPEISNATAVS